MKSFWPCAYGFLLLIVFSHKTTALETANQSSSDPAFKQRALQSSAVADEYVKSGWFTGNVLIAADNLPLFEQSYGYANFDKLRANESCTRFNLGSIAKIYTAVLVLQQIEAGALSLDTTIAESGLNIAADIAGKVTIAHLLKHKAGFRDIFVPEYMNNPLQFDTLEKKVDLLKGEPLLFEPGTDYRYSNYGYILLGAILEKLTGKSFKTQLDENIFSVIGATHTSLQRREGDTCQSERYVFSLEQSLEPTDFREVSGPDGGIEATASDVYRFFQAVFFTDQLVNRSSGSFKWYFSDAAHYGAYGGGTGVSAAVEVLRDWQLIIIVLANSDELVAEHISNRMVSFIQHKPVAAFQLPAKHFVYQQYLALKPAEFTLRFAELYKNRGYSGFMGRAINEAGLSLARAGQFDAATDIIGFLQHFYPTAPQAFDSLAYVFHLKGDVAGAKDTFRQALALSAEFNSDYHETNYGVDLQTLKNR
ncbi:serine hydrolase [Alteromonas sp. AMM-1]|uniref:serine hydrolase domain-containing protein n=1 Tax=Alteromonas sp. AMM-1 TaxID=3394233 RepID=UPI0039A72451